MSSYSVSYNFSYRNPASSHRVIIVGTAHVSDRSISKVKEIIDREKPDIVAVELDKQRYLALKGEEEVREINVKEMLSGGRFYYFLMQWLLGYVQNKIGSDMGIQPGAEMLAAIEKAEQIGARVALIDRDIQLTLHRFWNKMSFLEKLKLFGSLIAALFGFGKDIDIDTVTDEDVVSQLISELRRMAPNAASALLDERDAFMARKLLELSREGSVVAVVGAGHKEGIQRYLDSPETIPAIEELNTQKHFSWFKLATVAFLVMVIGLLALIIFSGVSLTLVLTALLYLFITQGILSAVGVILAKGHPLSALTAFSLAWFGFLHPFLAVGWLAGIVEAHFRPPSVEDFRGMMKAETFKELMQNKLFRIILVAGLANLGSMLGTFVAIPIMVHYLNIPNPLDILKTALEAGISMIK